MKKLFLIFANILLLSSMFSSIIASAHMVYSPEGRHMSSFHVTGMDLFCVDVKGASGITNTQALQKLRDKLYNRNYDGLANGKISLYGDSGNCSELSNLSSYVMRYYIKDDTSGAPCNGHSCVERFNVINTHNNNNDYEYAKLHLKKSTFTGSVDDYIINHETGHIMGIPDGNGSNDCPGSIMHSVDYGCSNGWPDDPYQLDLTTAQNNADSL